MADDPDTVQGRITAFWNVVASGYDTPENVAEPGTPPYEAWTGAVTSLLPATAAGVLDVGTGTGFLARIAAELGHRVTGIDLSERMLDGARANTAGTGLDVTFQTGDAVRPPFTPATFDVVISRSLIWTLREPEAAFSNWHALLRPGGRVVAIYGLSPAGAPEPEGFFARYYTNETREALPSMRLRDHEPLTRAAAAAGFHDVDVTPLDGVHGWETTPGSDLPYALVGYRRT